MTSLLPSTACNTSVWNGRSASWPVAHRNMRQASVDGQASVDSWHVPRSSRNYSEREKQNTFALSRMLWRLLGCAGSSWSPRGKIKKHCPAPLLGGIYRTQATCGVVYMYARPGDQQRAIGKLQSAYLFPEHQHALPDLDATRRDYYTSTVISWMCTVALCARACVVQLLAFARPAT